MQAIGEVTEGEVVAVGGKTLRRSFDRASSKTAIHMVSAWASKTGLVLGQVKTDEKSNETPAIPRLLEILRLGGCIVTIDAIGAQKEIVKSIIDKGAHHVISLEKNQPTLHEKTEQTRGNGYFARTCSLKKTPFDEASIIAACTAAGTAKER